MSACTDMFNSIGGDIITYNYKTNSTALSYTVAEQGINELSVLNNKIMTPGVDITDVPNTTESFYVFDGSWAKKRIIPNALHTEGSAFKFNNEIYVFTQNAGDDNLLKSADEGNTWSLVKKRPVDNSEFWFTSLGVFNGKLWMSGTSSAYPNDTGLFSYDGTSWNFTRVGLLSDVGYVDKIAYFNNKYFLETYSTANHTSMYTSQDLVTFSPVNTFNSTKSTTTDGYAIFDGKLFVSGISDPMGTPSGYLYDTADGSTWNLISNTMPSKLIYVKQRVHPLTSYAGRLYMGSTNDAKVYVSSVQSSGELISKPQELNNFNELTLSWNAVKPTGTNVKFQVKYASSEAGLISATFVGPDKTASTYFTTSGASIDHLPQSSYVQYKAIMDTADSKLTPYLEDITISSFNEDLLSIQTFMSTTSWRNGFNDSDLDYIAAHYKYFIADGYSYFNSKVSYLHQKNPNLKVLSYKNGTVIYNNTADWTYVTTNHPEWFLLDSGGNKIYEKNYTNNYLLDPSNTEWRTYRANQLKQQIENYGYDGIFLDVISAWIEDSGYIYYNAKPINPSTGQLYTNDEWRQANLEFVDYMKQSIGVNKLLIFNGIIGHTYYKYNYRPFFDVSDGAMAEGFMRWGTNPIDSNRSETQWKQDIDSLQELASLNKIGLINTGLAVNSSYTNDQINKVKSYSLSSYLLSSGDHTYHLFQYPNWTTNYKPYDETYSMQIGSPLSPYYKANNLYQRDFTNG
ncbi:hypothetical protein CO152_03560, partial [bacterium CG_4_9_14_3_um_filter_33_26]